MAAPAARASRALVRAHRLLADYFNGTARNEHAWDASRARPLRELPYHLAHAGRWRDLQAALTDFAFLQASVDALGPEPLVEHYDIAARAGRAYPKATAQGLRLLQGTLRPRTACLPAPGGALQRVLIASGAGEQHAMLAVHEESVNAVFVTPDGLRLVSSSSDRTVKVSNLRTGHVERTLSGGTGGEWPTERLVLPAPDSRHLVNATESGVVAMQRIATGATVWACTGDWRPKYVDVTPDSRLVLFCSDLDHVLVLDAKSGERVHKLRARQQSPEIVLSTPDGARAVVGADSRTIVSGGDSGRVHILDLVEPAWPPPAMWTAR